MKDQWQVNIDAEGLDVRLLVDGLGRLARTFAQRLDTSMKTVCFNKALTFPLHVQFWRKSPNKSINLISDLKLSIA